MDKFRKNHFEVVMTYADLRELSFNTSSINSQVLSTCIECLVQTSNQMRFYTRETLRSIMIPRLAKIPTLYRDWLRSFK